MLCCSSAALARGLTVPATQSCFALMPGAAVTFWFAARTRAQNDRTGARVTPVTISTVIVRDSPGSSMALSGRLDGLARVPHAQTEPVGPAVAA